MLKRAVKARLRALRSRKRGQFGGLPHKMKFWARVVELASLLGRSIGGATATAFATRIKYFIVLSLAATLVNMWVGVSKAGYSISCSARLCSSCDHFNSDLVENLLLGRAEVTS